MHGKAKWPLFWHKQAFSWPLDQHRRLAPLRWLSAATVGLRVGEDHEISGLDLSQHGEEGHCGETPKAQRWQTECGEHQRCGSRVENWAETPYCTFSVRVQPDRIVPLL